MGLFLNINWGHDSLSFLETWVVAHVRIMNIVYILNSDNARVDSKIYESRSTTFVIIVLPLIIEKFVLSFYLGNNFRLI